MNKWKKVTKIFEPAGQYPWMLTHASNPVADHIEGDIFRVYFSCRNEKNISSIAYVEVDINNPTKILRLSDKPVISPGSLGTFDDNGTSMACILNFNDKKYMYFLGWNLGVTVPWRNSIGLAEYDETTDSFKKVSDAPILDRNDVDIYSLSYPYVYKDGDLLRMYYGSNLSWGAEQKDMAHIIKYAESFDGVNWQREGKIAIGFEAEDEYAFSKPCVLQDQGKYKMWYSFRGHAYRIGYAESDDAINWKRQDGDVGISVSEEGWDSETVEYPFVFDHKETRYMLYNGNSYGKTGFGLAIYDS